MDGRTEIQTKLLRILQNSLTFGFKFLLRIVEFERKNYTNVYVSIYIYNSISLCVCFYFRHALVFITKKFTLNSHL